VYIESCTLLSCSRVRRDSRRDDRKKEERHMMPVEENCGNSYVDGSAAYNALMPFLNSVPRSEAVICYQ